MTNKIQTSIIVFSLIWLFTSCKEQSTYDNLSNPDVPLKVMSGIKTRSTVENNWNTGSSIGIMMFDSRTNELTKQKGNYQYIATDNGSESSFSPANDENTAYFPADGAKVDILGYYPYQAGTEEDLSVTIHTTDQSNLDAIDFLTSDRAYAHSAEKPTVALEFTHRLAKLDITIEALQKEVQEELKEASLIISGVNTNATWSLTENDFTSKGATGDISIPVIHGEKATAIIIPTTSENRISFTITTASNTYTADYTKDFEGGTVNTLHLKLKESTVTITSSIKPWKEGSGSGDAQLKNIVTGLSFSGIKTNGVFMLGTREKTNAVHTSYDYNTTDGTLTPAVGETPIYWEMLQGSTHMFQAHFIPTGDAPNGHEKDILSGISENIPFGGSIELEMKHAMAQLVVTLSSDGSISPGELKDAVITISVPRYTTEIGWEHIITGTDNARTITPQKSTTDDVTYIATIYPQTWEAGTVVMSLKLDDKADSKVYTLYAKDIVSQGGLAGSDFTLNAGDSYTLSAVLSKTEIGIQVTVDDNWKEVTGTGTFN